MSRWTADEFAAFFEEVHGYAPFPWQVRLADHVLVEGRWPDVLDLPTGVGKTSTLDIALFAMAATPETAPRRTLLVVDRRVIVDQGADHARAILGRLRQAKSGWCQKVTDALRALWGAGAQDDPFAVAVMRGGMPRDDSWALRPDQPVLGVSTVDQVGSRLLFRGYGLSPRMAPIHAGLLGNDALFLLDEVHLAVPLAETMVAIRDRWYRAEHADLPTRWGVVRMSATPGTVTADDEVFQLVEEDRDHPVLRQRLQAHKRVVMGVVTAVGRDEAKRRAPLVKRCVKEALGFLKARAQTVAIIVNRVDTARDIRIALDTRDDLDVVLLTGRMRPLDRDRVLDAALRDRLASSRDRDVRARPLLLVATQCIEAGADFDFDALVTECASLDALRQRFGRLDRCGVQGDSQAVVLARKDQVEGAKAQPDPVYGETLKQTWTWLQELDEEGNGVDLGIEALSLPEPKRIAQMVAPVRHAPVLLPMHLDRWAQTSPRPEPDPDPALWLHGPDDRRPDVQLIWRADLRHEMLLDATAGDDALADLGAQLAACPPGSLEALPVPIAACRAWLADSAPIEVSDVLGSADISERDREAGEKLAVRWMGSGVEMVDGRSIRPGDTLVVPASYGGIRFGNWAPSVEEHDPTPVTDLGDLTQWRQRGRAVLRLHDAVLPGWIVGTSRAQVPRVPSSTDVEADSRQEIKAWLIGLPEEQPAPWNGIVEHLMSHRAVALPNGTWALVARHRSRLATGTDMTTESDVASFVAQKATLANHLRDVGALAHRFGTALGLPEELTADLRLAGELHDLGKGDPRFQRMLVGGNEIRLAMLSEPIAKSSMHAYDARSRAIARVRAGYPEGQRHELLSVSLVAQHAAALSQAHDPELVLYLIGAHHGWGRPFAPPVRDLEPVSVTLEIADIQWKGSTDHGLARLDSGVPDRFWSLTERYGWWGLAWLDAIIRLADHRVSEQGEGVLS